MSDALATRLHLIHQGQELFTDISLQGFKSLNFRVQTPVWRPEDGAGERDPAGTAAGPPGQGDAG